MLDGIYYRIFHFSCYSAVFLSFLSRIFLSQMPLGGSTDIDFISIIQPLPVTGQPCGVFTFAAALTAIHSAIVLAIGTPNAP